MANAPGEDLQDALDEGGYRIVREDRFDRPTLDTSLWLPHHLPQWSSRARSAARFDLVDDTLVLRVDADQDPWCPEFDGEVRVSSLQTGVASGPLGSAVGQHRFAPGARVREEQPTRWLFTPRFGVITLRACAELDPSCMAALWMVGLEERPEESGVIDVFEIFGRDLAPGRTTVRQNVKAFGDPALRDDLGSLELELDATDFHEYAVRWTADSVSFYVDGHLVRTVGQAPQYPMQLMLGLYELEHDGEPGSYPKRFVVDRFRAYESGR